MSFIKSKIFSTGLAMFSMFFGAGNIIFPLAIGHYAQDKTLYAILGLLITAVLMPFMGLIAILLYEGDIGRFFGRMGKFPGFLLALAIITLLGPLGSTPRCIALSYTTLKMIYPQLSISFFSAVACLIIFGFSYRKNQIIRLLGSILTPLLLISLGSIIMIGLMTPTDSQPNQNSSNLAIFLHGLKEGYNTMDLLAAFFFSSIILSALKTGEESNFQLSIAIKASCLGAVLLALTYVGFSYISSLHSHQLDIRGNDELLAAITLKIIGPSAGLLVCFTIALACLTTAIALISVFSEFLRKDVCQSKISYPLSLAFSLGVTYLISILEFNGISQFLGPILQICYPGLIVLTILNVANRLWDFQPVRLPVLLTLAGSSFNYFLL